MKWKSTPKCSMTAQVVDLECLSWYLFFSKNYFYCDFFFLLLKIILVQLLLPLVFLDPKVGEKSSSLALMTTKAIELNKQESILSKTTTRKRECCAQRERERLEEKKLKNKKQLRRFLEWQPSSRKHIFTLFTPLFGRDKMKLIFDRLEDEQVICRDINGKFIVVDEVFVFCFYLF